VGRGRASLWTLSDVRRPPTGVLQMASMALTAISGSAPRDTKSRRHKKSKSRKKHGHGHGHSHGASNWRN
jgi:hypothetical protein